MSVAVLGRGLVRTLRHAQRALRTRRRWGLMAVVFGSVAIAVGLNTAIFSLVRGVLLVDPPFPRADRLVTLVLASNGGLPADMVSGSTFQTLRDEARAFSAMAGVQSRSVVILLGTEAWRLEIADISPQLFPLLGVSPIQGRLFRPEDEVGRAGCVSVIDAALWRTRFDSTPLVDLAPIHIDGRSCRIVGVVPSTHGFPDPRTRLWLPLDPRLTVARGPDGRPSISSKAFRIVARLRDGVSPEDASQELRRLQPYDLGGARLETIHEQASRRLRGFLWLLQGVAGLLLLIACAAVTGLLLADGLSRIGEDAIKQTLGASVSALVMERLAETFVLVATGGAFGVLLAGWALDAMKATFGGAIPQLLRVSLDAPLLAFAVGSTVGVGVLAGTVPALCAGRDGRVVLGRREPATLMRRARTTSRAWRVLVTFEVAMSLALIVLAMSLGTTFMQQMQTDRGYDVDHVALMDLPLPIGSYATLDARQHVALRLVSELERHPLVARAAVASSFAVTASGPVFSLDPPSAVLGERLVREDRVLPYTVVSEGYFDTMRIAVREGRAFSARDGASDMPVAIVSEAIVRRDFAGVSPLGRHIEGFLNRDWQIVGVVDDIRSAELDATPLPLVYFPLRQLGRPGDSTPGRLHTLRVIARAGGDAREVTAVLRQTVTRLDRALVPQGISTLRAAIQGGAAHIRLYLLAFGLFAAIGLAVASVGLSALLAHSVALRREEIGIRLALGAEPRQVFASVVRAGVTVALVGIGTGLPLALALRAVLHATVPGVVTGWHGLVISLVALVAVAVVASAIPAWRATRIDPRRSLRST